MSPFEFISVAASLVLGLALAQVLQAFVRLFRDRRLVDWDWLPLIWAVFLLLLQMQYWWGIFELDRLVPEWTILDFSLLLALPACLYVAANLILPEEVPVSGVDLRMYFRENGRWALAAIIAYHVLGTVGNVVWFGASLWARMSLVIYVEIALMLGMIVARDRRIQIGITLLFTPILVYMLVLSSTSAYGG